MNRGTLALRKGAFEMRLCPNGIDSGFAGHEETSAFQMRKSGLLTGSRVSNATSRPRHFTAAAPWAYALPAAEKKAAGGDSPSRAATSRTAFAMRLFVRLWLLDYGRPGGRRRKARRCSGGLSTPVRSALPFDIGTAVTLPQPETTTMQNPTVYPSALLAARDSLSRAQDNLQHVEAFPSLFSALCEAIEILSSDAVIVSSLASIGKQLADHLAILSTPVTQAVDDVLSSLRRAHEDTDHE